MFDTILFTFSPDVTPSPPRRQPLRHATPLMFAFIADVRPTRRRPRPLTPARRHDATRVEHLI